jgi:hypothetical protein
MTATVNIGRLLTEPRVIEVREIECLDTFGGGGQVQVVIRRKERPVLTGYDEQRCVCKT